MPSDKRTGNARGKTAGISRRDLVMRVAAGAGGLALAGRVSSAFAQATDVIKIGFVSPADRAAWRLRRRRPLRARSRAQGIGQRTDGRRQEVQGRDHRSGFAVRPGARQPIGARR